MTTKLIRYAALALFAAIFFGTVTAQDRITASAANSRYVISAKAGGVNFVEGDVTFVSPTGHGGLLIKGDSIQIGDKITTGADGKAEILLNPGSYLRLGGNSSFEFVSTSLDDLQIRIHQGSAILEVFAAEDFRANVIVPNTKFELIQTGIYRIDVVDGNGTIAVWKGRALVSDADSKIIKGGREATVADADVTVVKFDRDDKDSLDLWSKARAKELSKITSSFERREMKSSLVNSFNGGRWNVYDSFGVWVFDRRSGYASFLPFGYDWSSPYGHWFRNSLGWYNLPNYVYYRPITGFNGGGIGTRSTGTRGTGTVVPNTGESSTTRSSSPTSERRRMGRANNTTPPFVRMQGGARSTGTSNSGGGSGFPSRGGSAGFPSSGSGRPSTSSPSPSTSTPVSAGSRMQSKGDN